MKVLNASYLIERWPGGILILFIFMYKKNKYTVAQWCSQFFFVFCFALS